MQAEIAFIIRCDQQLKHYGFKRYEVRTSHGNLDRVFIAEIEGIHVCVIYGRHEKDRVPSNMINFMKTQEALDRLGARLVIGSFITGTIQRDGERGKLYIPHDLAAVGGGYFQSMYLKKGFRNVDALRVFCEPTRAVLLRSAQELGIEVLDRAVYACFHNFPRIETAAELTMYEQMGLDIVGQTLDPEVTLARESTCCYAPICVTIDDVEIREQKLNGNRESCEREIRRIIRQGREQMAAIMFNAIPSLHQQLHGEPVCGCGEEFHYQGPDKYMHHLPHDEIPFGGVI